MFRIGHRSTQHPSSSFENAARTRDYVTLDSRLFLYITETPGDSRILANFQFPYDIACYTHNFGNELDAAGVCEILSRQQKPHTAFLSHDLNSESSDAANFIALSFKDPKYVGGLMCSFSTTYREGKLMPFEVFCCFNSSGILKVQKFLMFTGNVSMSWLHIIPINDSDQLTFTLLVTNNSCNSEYNIRRLFFAPDIDFDIFTPTEFLQYHSGVFKIVKILERAIDVSIVGYLTNKSFVEHKQKFSSLAPCCFRPAWHFLNMILVTGRSYETMQYFTRNLSTICDYLSSNVPNFDVVFEKQHFKVPTDFIDLVHKEMRARKEFLLMSSFEVSLSRNKLQQSVACQLYANRSSKTLKIKYLFNGLGFLVLHDIPTFNSTLQTLIFKADALFFASSIIRAPISLISLIVFVGQDLSNTCVLFVDKDDFNIYAEQDVAHYANTSFVAETAVELKECVKKTMSCLAFTRDHVHALHQLIKDQTILVEDSLHLSTFFDIFSAEKYYKKWFLRSPFILALNFLGHDENHHN